MKTLIVKNFSGSFNDEYIGHEIINSFDYDNNKSDYYLFYLPPYGSIFSEKSYFNRADYKEGFDKIVIFEETGITNVLKLKAVAIKPVVINKKQYDEAVDKALYKGKKLSDIKFGSDEYFDPLLERNDFHVTYLIQKQNYYNLEKFNLLIWHKSNETRNNLKDESIRKAEQLFGKKPEVLDDTTIGQKNYCYGKEKIGLKFDTWFVHEVEPLLKKKNKWNLKTVSEMSAGLRIYEDNNLINNLCRTSDENLYTNFIKTILLQNTKLRDLFFSELVLRKFSKKDYVPSNILVETQRQSLIELKRAANSLIKSTTKKRAKKMNELINKCPSEEIKNEVKKHIEEKAKFVNGYIDLYLEDDNYRIVIENKIYSGINGKQDGSPDIDQIKTYNGYLSDLDKTTSNKENAVIILVPESEKNSFKNYGADDIITYKDLYEFFVKNKSFIGPRNRDDFINAIAFHALTKEEIITARFLKALS